MNLKVCAFKLAACFFVLPLWSVKKPPQSRLCFETGVITKLCTRGTTQIAENLRHSSKSNNFYALTSQSRDTLLNSLFRHPARKGEISASLHRFTPSTGSLKQLCTDSLRHRFLLWNWIDYNTRFSRCQCFSTALSKFFFCKFCRKHLFSHRFSFFLKSGAFSAIHAKSVENNVQNPQFCHSQNKKGMIK